MRIKLALDYKLINGIYSRLALTREVPVMVEVFFITYKICTFDSDGFRFRKLLALSARID